MKTKIFALILGLFCLCNMAMGQTVSPPLSGFNGKVQFNGFTNNGLFIRGTLAEFLDQTNQYFASDIDTNDVAWDNLGRKYRVVAVISSNLTQAVVDMARVGGGSHFPSGVGFISEETANGLALIPTANSIGISAQLASRANINNALLIDSLSAIPNYIWVSKANGNNATAKRGNPNKPFSDPFEAANNALKGDQIFVLDGVWWYGVGGEFDPYITPGILRNGITWNFSQGTKFKTFYTEDQYNEDTLGLFYTTETVNCKILGQLDLEFDFSDPDLPPDAYDCVVGFHCGVGSIVTIQIDSLIGSDFCNYETTHPPQGNISISAQFVNSCGYGVCIKNGLLTMQLNNVEYYEVSAKENSSVYIDFKKGTQFSPYGLTATADTTGSVFINSDNTVITRGNGNFNINQSGGYFRLQNTPGNVVANLKNVDLGGVAMGRGALYVDDNCNVKIICDNCFTNDSIYIRIPSINSDRNPNFIITGDIDLRGGNIYVISDEVGSFPDFKGLIFKDVLFLDPNPDLFMQYSLAFSFNLSCVFLNCWSNSNTNPLVGIIPLGEAIQTY